MANTQRLYAALIAASVSICSAGGLSAQIPAPDLKTVKRFSPIYYFHKYEYWFPCSIEHLLKGAYLRQVASSWILRNVTQADLAKYYNTNYYIDVNDTQFPGMRDTNGKVTAPLYYAVQQFDDCVEISYHTLYAFNGGQVALADRVGSTFHCILHPFAEHEGDLERVVVRLGWTANEFYVSHVGYEAHGTMSWYRRGEYWLEGDHPIVYVGLNSHASFNGKRVLKPVEERIPAIISILDVLGRDGTTWRPYQSGDLRRIGLDASGNPVGQEQWAKFQGRMGDTRNYSGLTSATYVDRTNLSGADWTYLKLIDFFARLADKYPHKIKYGTGPTGPGGRDQITNPVVSQKQGALPYGDTTLNSPFLFALKGSPYDEAWITNVSGGGWWDIHKYTWSSNYVGTAITSFMLNGHPHIFALKRTGYAYISRINDDGKGWQDIAQKGWNPNYVAIVSFQLKGHPYLFSLKGSPYNEGWITRINDDGKGFTDIYKGSWSSNYVGTAITSFMLNGHPHIFALKKTGYAYISRINDDGKGWQDIAQKGWNPNYVAIVSFQLKGHPYLFCLKSNNEGWIVRINNDGKGFTDIYKGSWSSNYVGTAITTFMQDGYPWIFALSSDGNGARVARINDNGKGWTHTYAGPWSSNYVAVKSFDLPRNLERHVMPVQRQRGKWDVQLSFPGEAGNGYVVLLGLSGRHPGFWIPGDRHISLNMDAITYVGLGGLGPIFTGWAGSLDSKGKATTTLDLSLFRSLYGLHVFAQAVTLKPKSTNVVSAPYSIDFQL